MGRRGQDDPGYLSVAGEGGVIEQEVDAEKHDDGVVDPQNGPVYEGGPSQQRVLGNISAERRKIPGTLSGRLKVLDYICLLMFTMLTYRGRGPSSGCPC